MLNVPGYISIIFGLTAVLTGVIFFRASGYSKLTLIILLSWLALQAFIGFSGFYTVTDTFPPRFLLMVLPPLLLIALLFLTVKGREYIDGLDQRTLTILHMVRIPIEIVLFLLCSYKAVPELMTFEGRNFDILSGISAPFIFYFGYVKKGMNNKFILFWNLVCLILLLNIIVNAVLSAPFSFQQFAFEQPNIAVLYFPFNWLPSCVVPLVLFSHLTVIRQLSRRKVNEPGT